MKFKKGDNVRLIKYPQATGIVSRVGKTMIYCKIDERTNMPFAEPSSVELNR